MSRSAWISAAVLGLALLAALAACLWAFFGYQRDEAALGVVIILLSFLLLTHFTVRDWRRGQELAILYDFAGPEGELDQRLSEIEQHAESADRVPPQAQPDDKAKLLTEVKELRSSLQSVAT